MVLGLIIVSGYTSINANVKAELFPTEIRALGVGLPYALTVSLFGGTAEFIALWMKNIGSESSFYYYVSACIALSLITYLCMGETSKFSQLDAKEESRDVRTVRTAHSESVHAIHKEYKSQDVNDMIL